MVVKHAQIAIQMIRGKSEKSLQYNILCVCHLFIMSSHKKIRGCMREFGEKLWQFSLDEDYYE